MTSIKPWLPTSWRQKLNSQPNYYVNIAELKRFENSLSENAPIVDFNSINSLLLQLSQSNKFILQMGDCAEPIDNFSNSYLDSYIEFYKELASSLGNNLLKIGRIAGQYSKPRTNPTETKEGKTLPNYMGDMVNDIEFSHEARLSKPERLVTCYEHASKTAAYLREKSDIYVSHESLNLHYEESLVRLNPKDNCYYATSGHFLWIGDKTRQLDYAHIEFLRGIKNPIGVKIGNGFDLEYIKNLLETLNPNNILGRLTLIVRMGVNNIENNLPKLFELVKAENKNILWFSDPMHGNSFVDSFGVKRRSVEDIKKEISLFNTIAAQYAIKLNGLHLEASPLAIRECVYSKSDIETISDYSTKCDPRLNKEQVLDVIGALK